VSATTAVRRAPKRTRRRHADSIQALDVFAGFGGMSEAMESAGVSVIHAANHNPYAIDIHEANHPYAEHLIADLVVSTRPDYFSAAALPYADYAHFSPSCVNHSRAKAQKLYQSAEAGLDDPDLIERATISERSRATMTCVLTYLAEHRPLICSVENVPEVQAWGKAVPGKSYGDGTTWRWWCRELTKLGYEFRVVYLNAQHFGVPQSRDRLFVGIWRTDLRAPAFEHRPVADCATCGLVELVQERKPVPPSGRMTYGKQYWYACPNCAAKIEPPAAPAYLALDFTDLGPTIGERLEAGKTPAASTMARLERAAKLLPTFPAILVPAKGQRGTVRLASEPMSTLTTVHETGLLAAQVVAAGNTYEHPGSNCRIRSTDAPMPAQTTTNTGSILTAAIMPYTNPTARPAVEPFDTFTTAETNSLLTGAVIPFRANTLPTSLDDPMATQTAQQVAGMLTHSALVKQNGGPADTLARSVASQFATFTTRDTTALLSAQTWNLLDLHWRMLTVPEIRRGMGFREDFINWGTSRQRVAGFGNAVVPAQGRWVVEQLTPCVAGVAQ
jgi:DNA (cytosine-5)-methyltransferase 1